MYTSINYESSTQPQLNPTLIRYVTPQAQQDIGIATPPPVVGGQKNNPLQSWIDVINKCNLDNGDDMINILTDLGNSLNTSSTSQQLLQRYLPFFLDNTNFQKISSLVNDISSLTYDQFKCLNPGLTIQTVCSTLTNLTDNTTLDNLNTAVTKYSSVLPQLINWLLNILVSYTTECGSSTDGKRVQVLYNNLLNVLATNIPLTKNDETIKHLNNIVTICYIVIGVLMLIIIFMIILYIKK